MINEFIDSELGTIKIVYNLRSRRVIARRKFNMVILTVPTYYTEKQIYFAFEELKPRIQNLQVKQPFLFTQTTCFETLSFSLQIKIHKLNNFYVTLKDKVLLIACPQNTNFNDSKIQNLIRNRIENVLRREAKSIIPKKVELLSSKYGFIYNEVKINKSRSRWGSCSSKKDINISYFCLLLPEYLIDFIILHELCHTIEMNHGQNFWKLLNNVTNDEAKKLTSDLNTTQINW